MDYPFYTLITDVTPHGRKKAVNVAKPTFQEWSASAVVVFHAGPGDARVVRDGWGWEVDHVPSPKAG